MPGRTGPACGLESADGLTLEEDDILGSLEDPGGLLSRAGKEFEKGGVVVVHHGPAMAAGTGLHSGGTGADGELADCIRAPAAGAGGPRAGEVGQGGRIASSGLMRVDLMRSSLLSGWTRSAWGQYRR